VPLDIDETALNAHVLRMVVLWQDAARSVARAMGLPPPLLTEADRMTAIKARAMPPESCGPEIQPAPAKGPMVAFPPMQMQPVEGGGYDLVHAGFRGRDAARAMDVWDEMARQARRAGGTEPFSRQQVATGRAYAALVERHSACGLRGISVETMLAGRGGQGGGGYADAVLSEGRRLDALVRAIGEDVALEVRRASRRARGIVTVRQLVDGLCLEGLTLAGLLRRAGWPDNGRTIDAARDVVSSALDRMGLV
jgi:hypothetical protein